MSNFKDLLKKVQNYIKYNYPGVYSDFNSTSIGNIILNSVCLVGDSLNNAVLSNLQLCFINKAKTKYAIYNHAQNYGYKISTSIPAVTTLSLYVLIPKNRLLCLPIIDKGFIACDLNGKNFFMTKLIVDFSLNYLQILYDQDYYLYKKKVKAYSCNKKTKQFVIATPENHLKLLLLLTNVILILLVKDTLGNIYYLVPYLCDDNVITYKSYLDSTNKLVYKQNLLNTSKRYISRVDLNDKTYLQFGISAQTINQQVMSPDLSEYQNIITHNTGVLLDPSSFIYSKTYGLIPYNTTLYVTYTYGGGINSNVQSNVLNTVSSVVYLLKQFINQDYKATYLQAKASLKCINELPGVGGSDKESLLLIKYNTINYINAQNRMVCLSDYMSRIYMIGKKLGYFVKASVLKALTNKPINIHLLTLNLYLQHVNCPSYLKLIIKNLLQKYRLLGLLINLYDTYVVNIGLTVYIRLLLKQFKLLVVLQCLYKLQLIFNRRLAKIDLPVYLNLIKQKIRLISGVNDIHQIRVLNKYGGLYSNIKYDINSALSDYVLLPPKDKAIFLIKDYNKDLKVVVV